MARDDVEIIDSEVVYDGHFRLDRYRLRHRQFAGGMGRVLTREVLERGRVAAVLPVDPVRDRVVLIEQFRPGAWAAQWEPWLLECVAGVIESGETPGRAGAARGAGGSGLRHHRSGLHRVVPYEPRRGRPRPCSSFAGASTATGWAVCTA